MTRPGPHRRLLAALALCAVALLNYAVVRSTLMQAAMTGPAESCQGAMAGMAGMGRGVSQRPAKAAHQTCEFCAAAAHAPVCTSVAAPAPPVTAAWVRWTAAPGLGARGPPPVEPRSRGPPPLRS